MDYLLRVGKYGLIFAVYYKAEPRSVLSNSVNIGPYFLSEMCMTVFLCSEIIYEPYICLNLQFHVQDTNAFSYPLFWRILYSSKFYC